MSLFGKLRGLVEDPPPEHIFEISEAGIAWARGAAPETGFEALAPGVLAVSPIEANVLDAAAFTARVRAAGGANGQRKRKGAVLVLPDYCGRIAVLDFDSFPARQEEQLSLVRFRLKKNVPFDVEQAAVSYVAQPRAGGGKKTDVVVAAVALEILAAYEMPFHGAGFQTGWVTTSSLAAFDLLPPERNSVLVKRSGKVLTVLVASGGSLRFLRCLELGDDGAGEVAGVLFPTLAYAEDELAARPETLIFCGFGPEQDTLAAHCSAELSIPAAALNSPFGTAGAANAGLYGYLAGRRRR